MITYDISVPLSTASPVWPGDSPVEIDPGYGQKKNVWKLGMTTHTCTHIDAPFHFLPDGRKVDELPLEPYIGAAWVADCRGVREVTAEVLQQAAIPSETIRLLLLTDNSVYWDDPYHSFHHDFVDIAPSGARWIVEQGIQLVGIDYMSVDNIADTTPDNPHPAPTHHILIPNGVFIIENLDLRHVPPNQEYELLCLPLKIEGGDGAPARVILRGG